ncbi:MAG: hypothetical protein V4619_17085 [Bacteroidota bacterium]
MIRLVILLILLLPVPLMAQQSLAPVIGKHKAEMYYHYPLNGSTSKIITKG